MVVEFRLKGVQVLDIQIWGEAAQSSFQEQNGLVLTQGEPHWPTGQHQNNTSKRQLIPELISCLCLQLHSGSKADLSTHTHTHIRLSPTRLSTSSIWMKLSESLKSAQTFTRAGPKQTARWEKHYKTSGVLDHTESAHSPDKQPQLQRLLWDQLNGISESWMRASVWQRRPDWRIYQVWMLSGNDYRTQNTLSLSAEYANMRITVLWKPHNTSNGEQHRYLYHLLLPSCSQVTEDANMTDFCASFLLKCC